MLTQLDRGGQREAVVRGLGHRVGGAERVLLGLRHRHRDRHHQAARGRDEQRSAHRRRDVVRPHPPAEHRVEQLERLLPERRVPLLEAACVQPLVTGPRVVDEQVQPAVIGGDPGRDRPDGVVVRVVARHRHAGPACRGHRVRCLLHRAGQMPGPPGRRGPRGHVHHPAGLPEGDRHATADAAAAPGHPGDPPRRSTVRIRHAPTLAPRGPAHPVARPRHIADDCGGGTVSLRRPPGRAVTGL